MIFVLNCFVIFFSGFSHFEKIYKLHLWRLSPPSSKQFHMFSLNFSPSPVSNSALPSDNSTSHFLKDGASAVISPDSLSALVSQNEQREPFEKEQGKKYCSNVKCCFQPSKTEDEITRSGGKLGTLPGAE